MHGGAERARDAPLEDLVDRLAQVPDQHERHQDHEDRGGDLQQVRVDAHRARPLKKERVVERHLEAVFDEALVGGGDARYEPRSDRQRDDPCAAGPDSPRDGHVAGSR